MKFVKEYKEPVISIITPFYNGGETLDETAETVFNQTYPFFEWIIVDDGSKDKNSLDKLEKLSKKDPRITVYHKENGGPSVARDFGISKANESSEFVFFLDCDDKMEPNMLEILYWTLKTHPDASFAYTAMNNFGDKEFIWERYLSTEIEQRENVICISSMVKKSDLLEVGCFGIKEKAMYEDWNLWLKLLAHGKKPIRVSSPLFWYRFSNKGEFSRAKENHERAMKLINETAKTIKKDVKVYQFPYPGSKYDQPKFDFNMILPFKNENKNGVLFIFPWMIVGGADVFNYELIKRIDKDKFNTYVCTTFPSDNPWRNSFINEVNACYEMPSFLEPDKYLCFVDYLIKSKNINTVFISNSKYAYYMVPYIKSKYPNIKIIDYIHSNDQKDKQGGFGRCSFDVSKYIDETFSCNNFTTDQLVNKYGVTKAKTIYIGTDSDKFDISKYNIGKLKEKYNVPKDKKIISIVGRLSNEKRPQLFANIALKMLSMRNDLFFIIGGDGPLFNDVKNIVKNNKNILMLGNVSHTEEVFAISDLTLNTSALEGLALTSYESLSLGVPVVTSNVGGQTELIDESVGYVVKYNEKNGYNFDNKDIDNYIVGINYCFENINKLKKNCRKKILDGFNYDNMAKSIIKHFNTKKVSVSDNDLSLGKLIYQFSIEHLYSDMHYLYGEYYSSKYGYNIYHDDDNAEEEKDISFKHRIKNKLIKFAYKKNIVKESTLLLNIYRTIANIFKSIVGIIYKLLYLIKFIILFIINIPVIIYKLVRKGGK